MMCLGLRTSAVNSISFSGVVENENVVICCLLWLIDTALWQHLSTAVTKKRVRGGMTERPRDDV